MIAEIDDMFAKFNERKNREKEARAVKDAEHSAFREKAVAIIEQHVMPVLEEISSGLRQRGHEAKISANTEHYSYPSAQLSFRVVSSEPHSYVSESTLSFATTTSEDAMEARRTIWSASGKDESHSHGHPSSKALSEVTSEWVKAQTLSFVQSVLSVC